MIGGCSVLLNGTTGWVNLGTVAARNFTSTPFSIMAWVYPTAVSAIARVLQHGVSAASGYSLRLSAAGALIAATSTAGVETNTSSANGAVVANKWQHLAAVRSGSSILIYVNGENVTSSAGTHSDPSSSIGASAAGATVGGGANFFPGAIDEPAFFNIALTQEEIREHMWLSIDAGKTGLVSLHHFDDGLANYASTSAAAAVGGVAGTLTGGAPAATWVYDRWSPWVEPRVSATGNLAVASSTATLVPGTLRAFIPRVKSRVLITAHWDTSITTAGTGFIIGEVMENGVALAPQSTVGAPAAPLYRFSMAHVLTTDWTAETLYTLQMMGRLSGAVTIRATFFSPHTGFAVVACPVDGTW